MTEARVESGERFPLYKETLSQFFAHGSRPTAGACAGAPHSRRAAVAAYRASVKDGHALTLALRPRQGVFGQCRSA